MWSEDLQFGANADVGCTIYVTVMISVGDCACEFRLAIDRNVYKYKPLGMFGNIHLFGWLYSCSTHNSTYVVIDLLKRRHNTHTIVHYQTHIHAVKLAYACVCKSVNVCARPHTHTHVIIINIHKIARECGVMIALAYSNKTPSTTTTMRDDFRRVCDVRARLW